MEQRLENMNAGLNAEANSAIDHAIARTSEDSAPGILNPVAIVSANLIMFLAVVTLATIAGLGWFAALLAGWVSSIVVLVVIGLVADADFSMNHQRGIDLPSV